MLIARVNSIVSFVKISNERFAHGFEIKEGTRLNKVKRFLSRLLTGDHTTPSTFGIWSRQLQCQLDDLKILTAKTLLSQRKPADQINDIRDAEFKVFSQFGDDGIIQHLIRRIEISSQTFIEFGVENYSESNTRFLLINNNWTGLVIDSLKENIEYLQNDDIYWKHDLTAVCAFVDKENINGLFSAHGFSGELGLLSIDIDGNDYWVWQAITVVNPIIVICEYNSLFGYRHAVTVPYDVRFNRTSAHPSNLFWGCSLKALCLLAQRKGYAFVGSNSSGNNAYFIRNNKMGELRALAPEEGYVQSKFRESRDAEGRLTYVSGSDRLRLIEDMIVHDVERECDVRIGDLP